MTELLDDEFLLNSARRQYSLMHAEDGYRLATATFTTKGRLLLVFSKPKLTDIFVIIQQEVYKQWN